MRIASAVTLLLLTAAVAPLRAQGPQMRFNQDNVPGWTLMTVDDRNAHRDALGKLKTYEECKTYMAQFREKMEARAREQGKTLRGPPSFVCDQLKASGAIR
jgi:hypothetical protein